MLLESSRCPSGAGFLTGVSPATGSGPPSCSPSSSRTGGLGFFRSERKVCRCQKTRTTKQSSQRPNAQEGQGTPRRNLGNTTILRGRKSEHHLGGLPHVQGKIEFGIIGFKASMVSGSLGNIRANHDRGRRTAYPDLWELRTPVRPVIRDGAGDELFYGICGVRFDGRAVLYR